MPGWQHEKWISRRFLAGKTVSPLRLVPDSASTDERICSINVSGRLFVFRKGGISFASRTSSNHLTACYFENVFSWRIDEGGRGERERKRVLRIDADEYFEMRRFLGEWWSSYARKCLVLNKWFTGGYLVVGKYDVAIRCKIFFIASWFLKGFNFFGKLKREYLLQRKREREREKEEYNIY